MDWIRRRTGLRQDHSTKRLVVILLVVTLGLGALFMAAFIYASLDDFDNQEIDRNTPAPQINPST